MKNAELKKDVITLTVWYADDAKREDAIREATRLLNEGYSSGGNEEQDGTGAFSFDTK